MTQLNQTNAEIDILKIDIEYEEYPFLHAFFSNNEFNRKQQSVYIRQILVVKIWIVRLLKIFAFLL